MILALDFDGVICDSLPECLATSYGVFRQMRQSQALPVDVPVPLKQAFLARRGFVRPSGHYYLLWKWITEFPERDLSPEQFEAMADDHRDAVCAFETAFHASRDEAREAAPGAWLALNPLFSGVMETWPLLMRWPRYVVTTKDEKSVDIILRAHGLSVTGVFARGGVTKPKALQTIARTHSAVPAEVVFIDDNGLHLRDAATTGASVALAKWGYGPRDGYVGPELAAFEDVPDFVERRGW